MRWELQNAGVTPSPLTLFQIHIRRLLLNFATKLFLACLITSVAASGSSAQKPGMSEPQLFTVPPSLGFVMTSHRSDSPIVIRDTAIYATGEMNRVYCRCEIQNVSNKAIRSVDLAIITNFLFRPYGGGRLEKYYDTREFGRGEDGSLLQPGERATFRQQLAGIRNAIPDETVSKIRQQPSKISAKIAMAVLVDKVVFADGTVYDASSDARDLFELFSSGIAVR